MTETEFLQQVKVLFDGIESKIETLDADLDVLRHDSLLEIESDSGHKIIINQQVAMSEVWLASRSGGYHFKYDAGQWLNTRDNATFDSYLNSALNELN
jgi:CyaY protein